MLVELRAPCPFHDEKLVRPLGSVAVWVIVEAKEKPKYFLVVQQADIEGNPWGVPAGREIVGCDWTPADVAVRELKEETGLALSPERLKYLWFDLGPKLKSIQLICMAVADISSFDLRLASKERNGTLVFSPPTGVDTNEISHLALIPLTLAFKNNLLNDNPYRPHYTYRGLAALRAAGYVNGSFPFEDDPGL